jgi:hypothetical protein
MRLFLLDRFTAAIYLRAYAPAFIAGLLVASLHSDAALDSVLFSWPSAASLLSFVIFGLSFFINSFVPSLGWGGTYLLAWLRTGLYLPVLCMMVFGAMRPRKVDPVASLCGTLLAPLSLGWPFCLPLLFFDQPLYRIASMSVGTYGPGFVVATYVPLAAITAVSFFFLSRPLESLVRSLLPPDDHVVRTTYSGSGRTDDEYPGVRLFLYYGSFLVTVATFCMAQVCQMSPVLPVIEPYVVPTRDVLTSALHRCSTRG